MGLVLIVIALLFRILVVHSCSSSVDGIDGDGEQKINKTFWQMDSTDQAVWDQWLEEYKKNNKPSSGETDAGVVIDDGRPQEWQGYGQGSGGQAPPPWAYFPGAYGKPDLCFQEPEIGNCKEDLTRWGYNPYMRQCMEFPYSGCGGNDNNFFTKPRCEIACAIDVATNCQLFDDKDQYI